MSEKPTNSSYPVTDFRNLTSPIVDVRSPREFSQGHWPGAVNIPLFSDSERETIGKSYKKESRLKAILKAFSFLLGKLVPGNRTQGTSGGHQIILISELSRKYGTRRGCERTYKPYPSWR